MWCFVVGYFILFYPGHPLFQSVSHVLPTAYNPLFSYPSRGPHVPSYTWPVTLLLIHRNISTFWLSSSADDVTGCRIVLVVELHSRVV